MSDEQPLHMLTVSIHGGGSCDCGETFTGSPNEIVEEWSDHVEVTSLLIAVREYVLQERLYRELGETAATSLLDFGLSTRFISEAVGVDAAGEPMMSTSTIQRIGKDKYVKTPRRRRRT